MIMTERLGKLERHDALFILRNALAIPKLLYVLRSLSTSQRPDLLEEYDETLKKALEAVVNTKLDARAWTQTCLPTDQGGLGFASAITTAPGAYLSSTNAYRRLTLSLLESLPADLSQETVPFAAETIAEIASYGAFGVEEPPAVTSRHQRLFAHAINTV
jgi:hypothetical protein